MAKLILLWHLCIDCSSILLAFAFEHGSTYFNRIFQAFFFNFCAYLINTYKIKKYQGVIILLTMNLLLLFLWHNIFEQYRRTVKISIASVSVLLFQT